MKIDVVIIGVNASKTLQKCIESILSADYPQHELAVFYVDGGSKDASVAIAKNFNQVNVIELNRKHPTPGSGRNAGYKAGNSQWVHFFDSDTIVDSDWFNKVVAAIKPEYGAIFGNRNEIHPDANAYHVIADLEWNGASGESEAFGGDVFIRRDVLEAVGAYDETLIAGEDPELSQRIRKSGLKLLHLNELMVKHDICMSSFKQYWKRAYRTGYGFAAVVNRHFRESFWKHELIRILIRGCGFLGLSVFGAVSILMGAWSGCFFLLLGFILLLFPRLFRVRRIMLNKRIDIYRARCYAWHCSVVVIPQFFGVVRYCFERIFNRPLQNVVK